MKHGKARISAWLLSGAMVLAMIFGAVGYVSAQDVSATAGGETVEIVTQAASSGWQPKPTRTVSSNSSFPLTLKDGDVLQINGPIDYMASTGTSPITVAAGANAKIIINGSVTLHGANASGTTGATAAIRVPSGAKLTIYSAHDEELSTSTAAPKDTLTVIGGSAAAGANGQDACEEREAGPNTTFKIYRYTGAGGNGGGGAAAAIGGNGGTGGTGAARQRSRFVYHLTLLGHYYEGQDDNDGGDGIAGGTGTQGTTAGTILILGRLNIKATGGSGAKGGDGGAGYRGFADTDGSDDMIGGCGGGGGGGGGLSAPAFGAGGCGGSGGGSGGLLSSDHHGDVQGCGGGGGGGAWPNGGGGGGGGAECSNALNSMDNKSTGGAGGAGGSALGAGKSGSAGTKTGTSGHGENDALPGAGGSGGPGVGVSTISAVSGGLGGEEKDHQYNGGDGGAGGGSLTRQAWHSAGCLVLSTAANLNTSSWGDGGGQGSMTTLVPYVVYDLMDCYVELNQTSLTYTGKQLRPTVKSVTYSVNSDRDKALVAGSGSTLASSNYSISGYGENIHCPSGTLTLLGSQNASRTTTQTRGAVVGSIEVTFTIKRATLTGTVSLSNATPYMYETIAATLSTSYTSPTAGSGKISSLLRESTQKAEGPVITWSLQNDKTGTCTAVDDYHASVTLKMATVETAVQATLRDMNDFENCTIRVSITAQVRRTWSATLTAGTPHPRISISVNLPSDMTSATYQWYLDGKKVDGATSRSYTPTPDDIGKKLTVTVTPAAETGYTTANGGAGAAVEDHSYSTNGFCTVCTEYQPATSADGVWQIGNGGQMFWFAALVNNDGAHAVFPAGDPNASALLTGSIDLEGREWKPIGSRNGAYGGTFDGQGNRVSGLSITNTASYLGFFGYTTGTIRDFVLEGTIVLSGSEVTRVGGAIGTAYGGTVSGVRSNVQISNTGNLCHHVGGVIGGVDNPETTIEQCVFGGTIQISASTDCIGGIVGYSNAGARIRYCANLGSVTATEQDAYTGGILGYVNNASPTLRNCYNYGTVQNGGGNYCGAIIGRLRMHTSANLTDNYYLDGSAPAGFGAGSNSTSAKTYAKSAAAFAGGEVCYLLNGSSSADDVIWRQNVDNGITPYDAYPVFAGGIVLKCPVHHDCTATTYVYAYSNSEQAMDHINHNHVNGFCACCDALQPAETVGGVYQITNGGQFFWFATQFNAGAIPQSSHAALGADIDLEGSQDGQAAGYEGIVKTRNFPGVGTGALPFGGTFSGNRHTVADLLIERVNETNTAMEDIGLFGRMNGATLTGLTVRGRITLRGNIHQVGGIVGTAYNSSLSGLVSYVNITNTGSQVYHVGGVAGEVTNGGSIFTSIYFGTIDLESAEDCIGGVVAYINDAEVAYCANHGTVRTATVSGYTGGVVGYLNNTGGSVHNCYNYGTVQNGGGNYCGAIIGWLRGHTDTKLTDNYYLDTSAPAGFGVGGHSTSAKTYAKDAAAFASGEVCYLVNGKISDDTAIWKQNIDSGVTPYDKYPVFDTLTVYFRSDDTCSNDPERISVTITWGAMEFGYHAGRWDPETHTYSGSWAPTTTGEDMVTVRNDSNVALNVTFLFTADEALAPYSMTGSFDGAVTGENRMEHDTTLAVRLALRSLAPTAIKDGGKRQLGSITVRLTTTRGGNG